MIDEFLQLPVFPQAYVDQLVFFEMLKSAAQNATNLAFDNISLPVQVSAATPPSQSQWEAAWIAKGYALPIPPSAILMWWDTANNAVGGAYGTTPTSAGVVYSRDTLYPVSGQSLYEVASMSTLVTNSTANIGALNSNHPSIVFTLPRLSDLYLTYHIGASSNQTSNWGADFLLDGLKVGTAYYGIPTNMGLLTTSAGFMNLMIQARVPNVPAGEHKVQAIMGNTGSSGTPSTLTYGGPTDRGLRTLIVRGMTI